MLVVEISVISAEKGDVLLRGTRLCIPNWMQKQVVDLTHKGHQGRLKFKSIVIFCVDETCRDCIPCQAY